MIALLLTMIRARRAQAFTVFLLAAVSVAAAVAGPVALRTVDRAIGAQEVAAASNTERSISVTAFVNPSDPQQASQFDSIAKLITLPGFDPIRAGELEAFGPVQIGPELAGAPTSRIAFRDRLCEHVTILSGRCVAGGQEVILGEDTAARTGLSAGDIALIQAARYVLGRGLVPDGVPAELTVVGVYRPTDPNEAYWAGQRYFPVGADGNRTEAVFTNVTTFDIIDHTLGQSSMDALAPPSALGLDRFAGLPAEVTTATEALSSDPGYTVNTDLPVLAERVQRSRELARQLVPVAFIPVAAIAFFVIYLAVGYGVSGRRPELGLVALRGVTPARRWWLATGETALVILAGAPIGYLLGHLGVAAVASLRLGSADGAQLSAESLPYAAGALVGALLVAVLGQRRALQEPVADLLRGVPRGQSAWRSVMVEGILVALAVVATVQLRAAGGLSGVGLLVPGLLVVGVALLVARLVVPVAARLSAVLLRTGRLAGGLSAVQLARRPGSQRLFVLLAVASGMLAFVAAGVDVAARAREDRALVVTGAPRVLTVEQADVRRLLNVTRAVDPEGSWAMAAVPVAQVTPDAPPVLAVDSTRLAAVAVWRPEFGVDAANVARALTPPPAAPFVFHGTQLLVDVETFRTPQQRRLELDLAFVPLAGGDRVTVAVTDLALGRSTRQVGTVGCTAGCRLTGFSVPVGWEENVRLVVHGVRQLDPNTEVIPGAELARRDRWRPSEDAQVVAFGSALAITSVGTPISRGGIQIAAVDAPLPVPVASAGAGGGGPVEEPSAEPDGTTTTTSAPTAGDDRMTSLDNAAVGIRSVASLRMLPRLGARGRLADLEYLERTALLSPRRERGEVWLGPNAPADAAERLRKAGLAITDATGIAENRVALGRQGPALALQFHLAAALFGVLLALGGLALVAAVDRRPRADDFRSLRRQGLPAVTIRRASLWGYLAIVVLATLVGLLGAVVAWAAAGDQLPVFTDSLNLLDPPGWPGPAAMLGPWLAAGLGMVVVAVGAGWLLRRASLRAEGRSRWPGWR